MKERSPSHTHPLPGFPGPSTSDGPGRARKGKFSTIHGPGGLVPIPWLLKPHLPSSPSEGSVLCDAILQKTPSDLSAPRFCLLWVKDMQPGEVVCWADSGQGPSATLSRLPIVCVNLICIPDLWEADEMDTNGKVVRGCQEELTVLSLPEDKALSSWDPWKGNWD